MTTLIHQKVQAAHDGLNPTVIGRTESGWVVLGDPQITRGYCLLLPDPVVRDLNALPRHRRSVFLDEMAAIGDALLAITGALRINYEMLGNLEPALHAHIIPRYADEPADLASKPIWFHDWKNAPAFNAATHQPLMQQIADELRRTNVI